MVYWFNNNRPTTQSIVYINYIYEMKYILLLLFPIALFSQNITNKFTLINDEFDSDLIRWESKFISYNKILTQLPIEIFKVVVYKSGKLELRAEYINFKPIELTEIWLKIDSITIKFTNGKYFLRPQKLIMDKSEFPLKEVLSFDLSEEQLKTIASCKGYMKARFIGVYDEYDYLLSQEHINSLMESYVLYQVLVEKGVIKPTTP